MKSEIENVRLHRLAIKKSVERRNIQKILGHNDIKTTLRYLYVTTRDLNKIKSPLDDMDY